MHMCMRIGERKATVCMCVDVGLVEETLFALRIWSVQSDLEKVSLYWHFCGMRGMLPFRIQLILIYNTVIEKLFIWSWRSLPVRRNMSFVLVRYVERRRQTYRAFSRFYKSSSIF